MAKTQGQEGFFVVLACHEPLLDGFDQHFQATVHFPQLGPSINLSSIKRNFFGKAKNQTQAHCENAAMQPPPPLWKDFFTPFLEIAPGRPITRYT